MYPKIETIPVTTDAAGAATIYSSIIRGRVLSIQYVKTDFVDGVSFLLTGETTGLVLWFESNVNVATVQVPTQPANTQAGGAITNGYQDIALVNERIKIWVTAGGDTKTGAFNITWE